MREYKHLVLGLLFLKYISDSFELRRGELEAELCDPTSDSYVEDPEQVAEILEDRDEYVSENVFWVPEDARWEKLLGAASQPDIAKRIDDAPARAEYANATWESIRRGDDAARRLGRAIRVDAEACAPQVAGCRLDRRSGAGPSLDLNGRTGQSSRANRVHQPVDRVIGQPNASVAASGPERIEQARASTAMDPDRAVAPIELLQDVAVGGQFEDPAAQKVHGMPRGRPKHRKQADRSRRARFADDHRYRANR